MGSTDLTTGSLTSHIRSIAIPASLGFLFNTLFNVVDTFFAGFLGSGFLAGLSLSFPVFFLIIALSSGIGTGTTALLSIALGKKKTDEFHKLAFAAMALGIILSIFMFFGGSRVSPFLFQLIGAKGDALFYGLQYTSIIFYGSFFFVINYVINSLLNSQGDTKSFRNSIILGFLLNLFLDPLFIMGWFGLPKFGIKGIAFATIIVQALGTVYLSYKLFKSPLFKFEEFKKCKLRLSPMWEIIKQGVPASLNMVTIAVGSFIINFFVVRYGGETALGAYGAALRIEQLALLPAVGLNIAVLTITGQNFGSGDFGRISELYKLAIKIGLAILTIGIIIIYPLSDFLVKLFNSDANIIKVGGEYLRIEVFAFYTYIIIFISNSVLQGIKKPSFGFYISILRQVVFPVVFFNLLGSVFEWGIYGVWWGIVITNWIAVIIVVPYTIKMIKKLESIK